MPIHRVIRDSNPGAVSSDAPLGLILTGGGARAAYQVGVLSGVLEILDPGRSSSFKNPFDIISGTSAGAINAAAIACRAHEPHTAIAHMQALWSSLRTEMVYHAGTAHLLRTGLRWFAMLAAGWLMPVQHSQRPRSLLDNQPLGDMLRANLDFSRLEMNLDLGLLKAIAVTATAYTTGEHLTFYQSRSTIKPWQRSLRHAVPCPIGVDHLLASSSIPFVFPAQAMLVHGQTLWCGDGSMRQLAPLSPAIHLGAQKIFVISTGHEDDTHPEERKLSAAYPTLAQIGGHALSNIFLDSVSTDIEGLKRINELLAQLPSNVLQSQTLRPVRTLAIAPSRSLDDIALEHLGQMPRAARTLFHVLGVSSSSGSTTGGALISYLLFEASYTQELIQLGRTDSMNRIEEVKAFFKETAQ